MKCPRKGRVAPAWFFYQLVSALFVSSSTFLISTLGTPGFTREALTSEKAAKYAIHGVSKEELQILGDIEAANIQYISNIVMHWPSARYESGQISDRAALLIDQAEELYKQQRNSEMADLGWRSFRSASSTQHDCLPPLFIFFKSNAEVDPKTDDGSVLKCLLNADPDRHRHLIFYSVDKYLSGDQAKLSNEDADNLSTLLKRASVNLYPVHERAYVAAMLGLSSHIGKFSRELMLAKLDELRGSLFGNLKGAVFCGERIDLKSRVVQKILLESLESSPDKYQLLQQITEDMLGRCSSDQYKSTSLEQIDKQALFNTLLILDALSRDVSVDNTNRMRQGKKAYDLANSIGRLSRYSWMDHETDLLDIKINWSSLLWSASEKESARLVARQAYLSSISPGGSVTQIRTVRRFGSLIGRLTNNRQYDEALDLASAAERIVFGNSGLPSFMKVHLVHFAADAYVRAGSKLKSRSLWSRFINSVLLDQALSVRDKAHAAEAYSSYVDIYYPELYDQYVFLSPEFQSLRVQSPFLDISVLVRKSRQCLAQGNRSCAQTYLANARVRRQEVGPLHSRVSDLSLDKSISDIQLALSKGIDSVEYLSDLYLQERSRSGETSVLTLSSLYRLAEKKFNTRQDHLVKQAVFDFERLVDSYEDADLEGEPSYRSALTLLAVWESVVTRDYAKASSYLSRFYVSKEKYRSQYLRFLDPDQSAGEIVEQLTPYIVSPYLLGHLKSDLYKQELGDLFVNRGLSTEIDVVRNRLSRNRLANPVKQSQQSQLIRQELAANGGSQSVSGLMQRLDRDSLLVTIGVARPITGENLKLISQGASAWRLLDRYVAIVVSNTSISAPIDLGPVTEVDSLIADVRAEITEPQHASFHSLSKLKAIWSKLSYTLDPSLGHRHVVLSGSFSRIPISLLKADDDPSSYSVYISESSLLRNLSNALLPNSGEAVVFANPDYGSQEVGVREVPLSSATPRSLSKNGSWQPLPATLSEANFIQKNFKAKSFLGSNATKKNFALVRSPKLLHLATHAYYQDSFLSPLAGSPLDNAGIILAGANDNSESSILTARDVLSLDLSGTELVVLSACETALGAVPTNMSVYGLQRAFEVAGARAVLAALWKVDDRATAEFVKQFYEALISGKSKTAALSDARAIFKNHPIKAWRHPYYWAAFELYGDPKAIDLSKVSIAN